MSEVRNDGKTEDLLRLDQQLCFPIYAATNLIQRLYRPLLEPLGLTYSQYLAMLVLWEQEPVTVGQLQSCLHLDVGTLSPLLKRMERQGLVTRTRDANDERRVMIGLTASGKALREAAQQVPLALAERVGADPAELDQLRGLTRSLVGRLIQAVPSRTA